MNYSALNLIGSEILYCRFRRQVESVEPSQRYRNVCGPTLQYHTLWDLTSQVRSLKIYSHRTKAGATANIFIHIKRKRTFSLMFIVHYLIHFASYRPQTKLGARKCFYTCLSLSSRGGGCTPPWQTSPGRHPLGRHPLGRPLWADTPRQTHPLGQTPPGRHLPRQTPSSRDGNWSGQYASYWNAFLFFDIFAFAPAFTWYE